MLHQCQLNYGNLTSYCCDWRTRFVVIWKHFCLILFTGTRIQIDSVICPWSSSRRYITSASVTVTVTVTYNITSAGTTVSAKKIANSDGHFIKFHSLLQQITVNAAVDSQPKENQLHYPQYPQYPALSTIARHQVQQPNSKRCAAHECPIHLVFTRASILKWKRNTNKPAELSSPCNHSTLCWSFQGTLQTQQICTQLSTTYRADKCSRRLPAVMEKQVTKATKQVVWSWASQWLETVRKKHCSVWSWSWVGLVSHQTHYRSYRGRVLRVKWPKQQWICQSNEGRTL